MWRSTPQAAPHTGPYYIALPTQPNCCASWAMREKNWGDVSTRPCSVRHSPVSAPGADVAPIVPGAPAGGAGGGGGGGGGGDGAGAAADGTAIGDSGAAGAAALARPLLSRLPDGAATARAVGAAVAVTPPGSGMDAACEVPPPGAGAAEPNGRVTGWLMPGGDAKAAACGAGPAAGAGGASGITGVPPPSVAAAGTGAPGGADGPAPGGSTTAPAWLDQSPVAPAEVLSPAWSEKVGGGCTWGSTDGAAGGAAGGEGAPLPPDPSGAVASTSACASWTE